MQTTLTCWKCLFISKADQRRKIMVSASCFQPYQLPSASHSLCKGSGPTSLVLHPRGQQGFHCHKRCLGQGIAPLQPTRTSHRPCRKQAFGLESQCQGTKRPSGRGIQLTAEPAAAGDTANNSSGGTCPQAGT